MSLARLAWFAAMTLACSAALAQELRLPFAGRWFVFQGGDTPNVNHHFAVPAQWYGIDFVKVGGPSGRELATTPAPTKLEDFYSWNEAVLAPVAGEVVEAVDAWPDNPLGTHDREHPAGNHVVIRTAEDRFVFLAHFRRGSVRVAKGDRVSAGQPLGRCGNSGNSDAPHIHLHVQHTLADHAKGQNPVFAGIDVELNGKAFANVTWPLLRGLFVSNAR